MDSYKSRQVSQCIPKHCFGGKGRKGTVVSCCSAGILTAPSCLFKGTVRRSPYCRFCKTGFLSSWQFNIVNLPAISLALSFQTFYQMFFLTLWLASKITIMAAWLFFVLNSWYVTRTWLGGGCLSRSSSGVWTPPPHPQGLSP